MDLPKRKPTRLKEYDYSTPGAYFITICTQGKKQLLSKITSEIIEQNGYNARRNIYTDYGLICDKYINNINTKCENVTVDKYVIMPNHIHMIIIIFDTSNSCGTMRASSPTNDIKSIIRSFKTLVTKEIGYSVWQRSYHDHIIRGENDYRKIWEYIDSNVERWEKDCFYSD